MSRYSIPYFIAKDDEVLYSSDIQVSLTKKDIAELEQFVIDHNYSYEFVDIPAHIYDKCNRIAFEDALKHYKQFCEPDAGLSLCFGIVMPDSLIEALSEPVAQALVDNIPDEYLDEEETEEECFPEPTKDNTLYLTIKQTYFDQIMAGTKKEEYREIKKTTYKKYLEVNKSGCPYYYNDLISDEEIKNYSLDDAIFIYNNGNCPLVPKQSIRYLNLAVGYNKVRDTALVQVTDITFETLKDENGNEIRFNPDGNPAADGVLTFWVAVFHLGEVVEKNIVSK